MSNTAVSLYFMIGGAKIVTLGCFTRITRKKLLRLLYKTKKKPTDRQAFITQYPPLIYLSSIARISVLCILKPW